jgi:hypothetical protein
VPNATLSVYFEPGKTFEVDVSLINPFPPEDEIVFNEFFFIAETGIVDDAIVVLTLS